MFLQRQYFYPENKRSSALVMAVWVLVFFSILALGLYRIAYTQLAMSKTIEERVTGLYIAKAALVLAQFEEKMDETSYDILYELAKEREKKIGRIKFSYNFVDEESKINLNKASKEIVERLPEVSEDLAKQISGSKLKPFEALEEVMLVDGMDEEILRGFRELVTVYSSGGVNINTASSQVLQVLGMDEGLAESIESYRAGIDLEAATEDDNAFESTGEIINTLKVYTWLSKSQEDSLQQLIGSGMLGVESPNLSIVVKTGAKDKGVTYEILTDGKKIKRWQEH